MQRRQAIKTVGSIALGSAFLGSANASAGKEGGGLHDYEQYCRKLVRKHGRIQNQKAAQNSRGEVETLGNTPETQDIAPLYDSEKEFAAVEEQVFEDGATIAQTVTSDNGDVIRIEINGRRYTLRRANVEKVLERRKQQAEKRLEQSGAHQNDTAIEPSTSDVSTSSVVHWKDEFSNSKEAGLSTPFIGDTYNNAGKDHCNTAAEAAVSGAASGYAEAWDNVNWYWDGDLLANFEGSYNGAAWNVLASSELKLHFKIKSNGDQLGQTYAKYKSSFLGDYWHEESNYDEYIFVPSAPDSFTVKMKGYSVAAAIGTSTTAISAADPLGSNHHGYFDLDHYTLDHQ